MLCKRLDDERMVVWSERKGSAEVGKVLDGDDRFGQELALRQAIGWSCFIGYKPV